MGNILFDKVLQITSGNGYVFDGPAAEGFDIIHPYKAANTFLKRCIREVCFRVPLLPKKVWFNKDIFLYHPDFIIVSDSLTTRYYLLWLQRIFPNAQINFIYNNLVGKARHIKPRKIPSGIRKWTFDEGDGKCFDMRVFKNSAYPKCYVKPKDCCKYDIFYVGADKGRGDFVMDLDKKLKSIGLKTKFIVTADGKYARSKDYYQDPITYDQMATYLSQSRAVLNVALKGQVGITMRDKDALFFNIKLITTNERIRESELYTENNVYVLNEDNIDGIPSFLNRPLDNMDRLKEKYTFSSFIKEVTSK